MLPLTEMSHLPLRNTDFVLAAAVRDSTSLLEGLGRRGVGFLRPVRTRRSKACKAGLYAWCSSRYSSRPGKRSEKLDRAEDLIDCLSWNDTESHCTSSEAESSRTRSMTSRLSGSESSSGCCSTPLPCLLSQRMAFSLCFCVPQEAFLDNIES